MPRILKRILALIVLTLIAGAFVITMVFCIGPRWAGALIGGCTLIASCITWAIGVLCHE